MKCWFISQDHREKILVHLFITEASNLNSFASVVLYFNGVSLYTKH